MVGLRIEPPRFGFDARLANDCFTILYFLRRITWLCSLYVLYSEFKCSVSDKHLDEACGTETINLGSISYQLNPKLDVKTSNNSLYALA